MTPPVANALSLAKPGGLLTIFPTLVANARGLTLGLTKGREAAQTEYLQLGIALSEVKLVRDFLSEWLDNQSEAAAPAERTDGS